MHVRSAWRKSRTSRLRSDGEFLAGRGARRLNTNRARSKEFMATEAAADAMTADGVRAETLLVLNEG